MPVQQTDFSPGVGKISFFRRQFFSWKQPLQYPPLLLPPPLLGVKISWKDARRCVIPINTSQKFSQGSSTVEESEICINPSERAFLCRFKPILTYFLRRSLTETGSNWVAGNRSGLWQISNQTFLTDHFFSKVHIIKTYWYIKNIWTIHLTEK